MFKLSNIITQFNQTYQKKVKLNKSWGLFYLQPESLALLNKNAQLIRDSVYYEPPFTTSRKGEHKTSAETKFQPIQHGVSAFRDSIRKINMHKIVSHRLSWEERVLAALNNDQVWFDIEEEINKKDESIKQYFHQVRKNWNIHKPVQFHSNKGLLFLLNLIVKYQDHFSEAYKELQRKKQTWIPFSRIPPFIAAEYESFLKQELEKFELLRKQVFDALLLRLKTAEQQGLVTCDDVSYTLALQGKWFNLIKLKLPEYRILLDTNTFNDMQRAIEKHGDESHISQLYQLAWYQDKNVCNSNEITTMTMSGSRFLTPSALLTFMSKKKKKWFWFSFGNKIALQFLEKQQALLAQLFLQPVQDKIILNPIYEGYPALLTLSTQYQLLQQSRCSLKQQPLYWWQWEKKFWRKVWQEWLGQQLDRKQVSLLNQLNETFEESKKYNFQLRNVKFREQVQVILETIQALMNEGVSKCENEPLINMFKYVHENSQDSVDQIPRSPKVSPKISPQPIRVKGMQEGKSTGLLGLLPTKLLAGNKTSVSTEKKPEMKINAPKMR